MRALRSCDFCETDAVGTFEVVPTDLEPDPHEQRRVVLCEDCKRRLETIIEPLVARAGASAPERDHRPRRALESAGTADASSGSIVASADESTEKRPRTRSPNASVSDSRPEGTADSDATSEVTFDRDGDGDGAEASETTDGAEEASETVDAAGEPPETVDAAGDTARPAARSSAGGSDETGGEPDATSAPPRAYGKVVRLLRNREFPMERAAVEELAAGAYDLEAETVGRIVDAALENGEFEERGGKLYRS